jgi:3-hydroxyacyl-[acyl-carrier-protein] dehydratase
MSVIELQGITKIIPQRFPFLLIDRVIDFDPGKKVVAIKNVTANEAFFQGHFPGNPIFPGALLLEAMAQTSCIVYHTKYQNELTGIPTYILGSVKASFKHFAVPGDQIRIEAVAVKVIPTGGCVDVKSFVGEKLIAEAELFFAVKK